MKDRLLLFKLTIKSSFKQNIEVAADNGFDTLQFYIHEETIMRIRTYALDHDIHIHQVNLRDKSVAETMEMLIQTTKIHYGDAIEKEIELTFTDRAELQSLLKKEGLLTLVEAGENYLYWKPDKEKYKNQSNPL